MRWEVFHDAETNTVTFIDAPEGYDFVMPKNVGASIGSMTIEPNQRMIVSKTDSLVKTWLTHRLAMLGIEASVEKVVHLPML